MYQKMLWFFYVSSKNFGSERVNNTEIKHSFQIHEQYISSQK